MHESLAPWAMVASQALRTACLIGLWELAQRRADVSFARPSPQNMTSLNEGEDLRIGPRYAARPIASEHTSFCEMGLTPALALPSAQTRSSRLNNNPRCLLRFPAGGYRRHGAGGGGEGSIQDGRGWDARYAV